jgi:hypothetical protein
MGRGLLWRRRRRGGGRRHPGRLNRPGRAHGRMDRLSRQRRSHRSDGTSFFHLLCRRLGGGRRFLYGCGGGLLGGRSFRSAGFRRLSRDLFLVLRLVIGVFHSRPVEAVQAAQLDRHVLVY